MIETGRSPRGLLLGSIALILLTGAASYSNSLHGEFVFDDIDSIFDNDSIKTLDPLAIVSPPPGMTVSGRPLLNLSLALNYAVGEYDVVGYHLVNIVIHLAVAVVLFLLTRGTLQRPCVSRMFQESATGIALVVALIWVAHPLQTEVVSYVVQRGEALAALFFLLTLYCVLRGAEWAQLARDLRQLAARDPAVIPGYQRAAQRASRCYLFAIVCTYLGVLSKEIIVVAPVLALLYDRIFLAGSFRQALRERLGLHAALLSSWVLLALLIISAKGRGGTVGFDTGVSPIQYAISQSMWILHYIRLAFWPTPLVFDYGFQVSPWDLTTKLCTCVILLLIGATAGLYSERPALGFLMVAFFAVLAPTSSFIPIATQIAAERRVYVALAPLIVLVVLGAVALGRRLPASAGAKRILAVAGVSGCVLALALTTYQRNRDYRTALGLWTDTLAKVPDNPRAQSNYGQQLLRIGDREQALVHLRRAVELCPHYEAAECVLGIALIQSGRTAEAVRCFQEMTRYNPQNPTGIINLAAAYQADRQYPEAADWYRRALEYQPQNADLHYHLGQVLTAMGRDEEARASYRMAESLDPTMAGKVSHLLLH